MSNDVFDDPANTCEHKVRGGGQFCIMCLRKRGDDLDTALRALVQPCGCSNPTGGNEFHRAQHRAMQLLEWDLSKPNG